MFFNSRLASCRISFLEAKRFKRKMFSIVIIRSIRLSTYSNVSENVRIRSEQKKMRHYNIIIIPIIV